MIDLKSNRIDACWSAYKNVTWDKYANTTNSIFGVISFAGNYTFTTLRHDGVKSKVNLAEIARIYEFQRLPQDWDSYGAAPIQPQAAADAIDCIKQLDVYGMDVYQASPGPNGEIMLQMKEGIREIEFLFYGQNSKYVTFLGNEYSSQGEFLLGILPELLTWLNNDEKGQQSI